MITPKITICLAATFLFAASSCTALKPEGAMKSVAEGSVFEGETPHLPPDNTNPLGPPPPPVRWKMRF
jgi:hypothetical protein